MPDAPTTERIFIDWDEPALPAAVRLLADRYAQSEELDLGGVVVVLPGTRAGRRLTELLVAEADDRDLRLVPPRISTIGALPDLLHEPERPVADGTLCRRIWFRALRRMPGHEARLLFPAAPSPDDALGWAVLAAEVDRLHRLAGGGGFRFRDVAACCRPLGDALGHDDAARWEALARVQTAYERELRELGRCDRELARIDAVTRGDAALPGDVWLVGVTEIPAGVRSAIVAAAAPDGARLRAVVHAPGSRASDFDELGCVRSERWLDAEMDIGDDRLRVVDRPPHQAMAALAEIAALDGRYAADEIVIGAPDDEVVPYIEQCLASAGLPARYAGGVGLPKTGPFRLLRAVADYLDGRGFEAFAALLRHPELAGWLRGLGGNERFAALAETDGVVVAADAFFAEHLTANVAGPLPGRSRGRYLLESLRHALESRLLADFGGSRPSRDWPGRIMELLVATYGASPLSRSRPDQRRMLEACQRIRDAAAALHRLPHAVDAEVDAATAIRLLLLEAEAAGIAPEPERAAIEVLGWLELHLDDAPVAIVTGVNEPHLPESINADPFLPNALRSALGLLDNETRYARDAYLLTSMIHSRKRTTLIAGRRSATGDPLRPSRLILALRGARLARRVLRFHGQEGEQESPWRDAARAGTAGNGDASTRDDAGHQAANGKAPARFELPPHRTLTLAEPVEELSVTELRTLLADPYRWCLERSFDLATLDDEARELDPLAFGKLTHDLLRRFAWTDEASSSDEAAVRRRLHALLGEVAAERYGRAGDALPAVSVQIQQLRARLDAFAVWQARRVADGWRIAAVEGDAVADGAPAPRTRAWFELDVDGAPVRIVGRIDRIDHHAERDLWAILDYKTGDAVTEPENAHRRGQGAQRGWVDLQLPMYRHLARKITDRDGRPLVPVGTPAERLLLGYVCVPRDTERLREYMAPWTGEDLADADERARDAIRVARRGQFRFDAEAAARQQDRRLAAVLGLTQLVAADAEGGEEPEADT